MSYCERIRVSFAPFAVVLPLLLPLLHAGSVAIAQTDPGSRGGAAAEGGPISGLSNSPTLLAAFNAGAANFAEVEDVPNNGLGPRFNSNSCVSCNSQPAAGGTSPAQNPQVQFVNSRNQQPPFIQANGPVREARFIKNPDGTSDGGVHDLFTIEGRSDTPSGCNLNQPDFSNAANMIFRIPTPLFGAGLIEAIPDSTLAQNLASSGGASLGIFGRLNRNGNDGTVTRFGWKAQNKLLLLFAGEAYNVEMGITNLIFNTDREESVNCSPLAPPNSIFNLGGQVDQAVFDDINAFANFMRFLAPPRAVPSTTPSSRARTSSSTLAAPGATQRRFKPAPARSRSSPTRPFILTRISPCITWDPVWPIRSARDSPAATSSAPRPSGASDSGSFSFMTAVPRTSSLPSPRTQVRRTGSSRHRKPIKPSRISMP